MKHLKPFNESFFSPTLSQEDIEDIKDIFQDLIDEYNMFYDCDPNDYIDGNIYYKYGQFPSKESTTTPYEFKIGIQQITSPLIGVKRNPNNLLSTREKRYKFQHDIEQFEERLKNMGFKIRGTHKNYFAKFFEVDCVIIISKKSINETNESKIPKPYTEDIVKDVFSELTDKYDDIIMKINPGAQEIIITLLENKKYEIDGKIYFSENKFEFLQLLRKDIDSLVHRFLEYHVDEKDEKLLAKVSRSEYTNFYSGHSKSLRIHYVPDSAYNRANHVLNNHLYLLGK